MKILTTLTEKKWIELNPSTVPTIPAEIEKLNKQKISFEDRVTEILLTDNLIVLTGLGPSMSLNKGSINIAPSMQDLWDAANTKAGADFKQILIDVKYVTPVSGVDNIELLLSNCLTSEKYESKPKVKKFLYETNEVIRKKCDFVKDSTNLDKHETFLRRMARRPSKKPRLKLFTTNYDLCFEKAASNISFIVLDGFSFSLPPKFDNSNFDFDIVRRDFEKETQDYIPNALHLYKIHGSVNWDGDNNQIIKKEKPIVPLMIYPMNSKYELSFEQPFLEMMSRFQNIIRKPNTALITIGFGFNDNHLSQPIMSAIKSNISFKYLHVSLGLEGSSNEYVKKIADLIIDGDSRLQMLEASFDKFTESLPDIAKASEEEIFIKRIKKI